MNQEEQAWHQQWKANSLQSYRKQSLDDLMQSHWQDMMFINGQLNYGIYDYFDLYGNFGHIESLYLLRQIINEKRVEQGLEPIEYEKL